MLVAVRPYSQIYYAGTRISFSEELEKMDTFLAREFKLLRGETELHLNTDDPAYLPLLMSLPNRLRLPTLLSP